ncbi:MAG: glutamate-cysteine ligase family protein [Candidatus Hodarchaeales archaeon]|jgi:gamma-glutamyl:cysteine ligase YbdK (ATP-grasp superfamily)
MFPHRKKKNFDHDQDPIKDYNVLCGIEEEFLIITKDGTLVNAADEIMVRAAEILERDSNRLDFLQLKIRGLDAEPSPSQIEYVTLPLPPKDIAEAVVEGRKLLSDAANQLGYKIFSQSLHPIQSDPHPMSGTHINVSVQRTGGFMNVEELAAVHNFLWNYLPELIALSANSPIFQGSWTNVASNRINNSTVLKPNGSSRIQIPKRNATLVPMQYYGRMRYTLRLAGENVKKVITNPRGERLVDITPRGPLTNIGEDDNSSLMTNRVEVRIFDVQQDLEFLLDLAYLCCVSALHAIYLYTTGEITPDPNHRANVERAVYNGIKTRFIRDGSKTESLQESVTRWVNETEKYQDLLGIKIRKLPKINTALKQDELTLEVTTRKIEELRQQGKVYAVVQLNKSRTITDQRGRKYGISRGTQVQGKLSVDYKLSYQEEDNIVTNFQGIRITNTLDVQGVKIPLDNKDRILVALSRSDYLSRSLFGGFRF